MAMIRSVLLWLSSYVVCNAVLSKGLIRPFPNNFKFGASTTAYQIEGGWNDGGKGRSIWDVGTHNSNSPVEDGSTGDIAADSFHLYKRDVEMMKELGLDFYRLSVSWPRILPNGFSNNINEAGIDYYNNVINEMLENKIKPFLIIYHWDLPYELQRLGGWVNPLIVDWFADYAKLLFDRLGDRVNLWLTINDPKQICYAGYGSDLKAPFLNMTGIAEYMCARNVLLAHAKVYHLYDEVYRKQQKGRIGISIGCTWFEPASDSIDDYQAAVDARQFDWGQYAHPIFSMEGDFPNELKLNIRTKSAEQGFSKSRLPELTAAEVATIRGTSDFFGMNSYTTKLAYRDASLEGMFAVPSYSDDMGSVLIKDPSWPQSEATWLQEVPWGFYKLFTEIKKLYGNPPVYVTENGWANDGGLLDEDRIHYLRSYLNALLDAIDEGCDVQMYTAWSLIDQFEWLQGYSIKFGLYEVDFNSVERTRTPRKSAFIYKEVIRSKHLDPDYEPDQFIVEDSQNSQEKDNKDINDINILMK